VRHVHHRGPFVRSNSRIVSEPHKDGVGARLPYDRREGAQRDDRTLVFACTGSTPDLCTRLRSLSAAMR
jgi:hypothetical protein